MIGGFGRRKGCWCLKEGRELGGQSKDIWVGNLGRWSLGTDSDMEVFTSTPGLSQSSELRRSDCHQGHVGVALQFN